MTSETSIHGEERLAAACALRRVIALFILGAALGVLLLKTHGRFSSLSSCF